MKAAKTPLVVEGQVTAVATLPRAGRRLSRRRRASVLLALLLTLLAIVAGQIIRRSGAVAPETAGPAVRAAQPVPGKSVVSVPRRGFAFAAGRGPVLGSAGTVRRFEVAVQRGSGDSAAFAAEVDRILGDPRSWIAGRTFRLQRVPRAEKAEFTVYLAAAATSATMCADGGLDTEGFSSCRLPGKVIINADRWDAAVPGYDAPLPAYRAYVINHEVGHQLGHRHETCPGKGRRAPVMMQQTFGLDGCVANAWPYVRGRRYAGNPAA
ncbi:lipoprotein [Actinoplanes sp. NBRC 14428]|nr:lipoprotein [Actinoplanes sp. NBRC 14428]